MSWGNTHNSNSFPLFVNGMKSAGYANTLGGPDAGVWGVNAEKASGSGSMHTGWVYAERGKGGLRSITISDGGIGYSNDDTWEAGSASGTLGVDEDGTIISVFIENPGEFTSGDDVPVTITTEDGDGAVLVGHPGGRAGRVRHETLVAMSIMNANNSIYDDMP